MANYYTEASFLVHFDNEEKKKEATTILLAIKNHADEPCKGPLAKLAEELELNEYGYLQFRCDTDVNNGEAWWISQDESISPDHVAALLSYLVNLDLISPMGFEFSHTCSKPRLDAYGGGCAFVTKKETYWDHTGQMLNALKTKHGK